LVESPILTFSHICPDSGGPARGVPVFLLTGQLAQVPGAVSSLGVIGREKALLQPELEANTALAVSLLANLCPLVTLRLIILFIFGLRTLRIPAIAEGCPGALVVPLALPVHGAGDELAVLVAAGPFTRRTLVLGRVRSPVVAVDRFESATLHFVLPVRHVFGHTGVAALLGTLVFIKSTVAFLPLLHNLVSTESSVGLLEAV